MKKFLLFVVVAALFVMAPTAVAQMTEVGPGEGQVDIIAWAGYIERGDTIQRMTGSPNLKNKRAAWSTSRPPQPRMRWLRS